MSTRFAAALTTCQIAFGVRLAPHIFPTLPTRRKRAPVLILAASVQSSTTRFAHVGTEHGANVLSLANQVGDYPVLLTDLKIFQSESNQFGASQTTTNQYAKIARSRLPRRLSPCGSASKVLDCSTVSQFPIRMPKRFAPLTRPIPAASSGLRSPVSAASCASRLTAAKRTFIVEGARFFCSRKNR